MNKRYLGFKKITMLGILFIGICAALNCTQVFAKVSESDLLKKAANEGLYNCYHGFLPSWQIIGTSHGATFNNVSNLSINSDTQVVALPTSSSSRDNLTCKEFYSGGSGFGGLFAMGYGVKAPGSSDASKADFLQKVGYDPDGGATSNRACLAIKYSVTRRRGQVVESGPTEYNTNFICATLDESGNIDADDAIEDDGRGTGNHIIFSRTNGGEVIISTNAGQMSFRYSEGTPWNDLVNAIKAQTEGKNFVVGDPSLPDTYNTFYQYTGYDTSPGSGGGDFTYRYVVNDLSRTYSTATNNIFGGDNRSFNKTETISLYQHYLNTFAEDRACTDDEAAVQTLIANGYNPNKVRLIKDGKYYNNCYVKGNASSLNAVNASGQLEVGTEIDIDGIISYLNRETPEWIADVLNANIHFPNEEDPEGPTGPGGGENPGTGKSDATDACYGSPGSLGLSWILCPVLSGLSNTLNYFYGAITEDYIQVKPELFENGNDAYKAWQIFQNIANIILVIFLLVVIFSQLTGIGIDNYGIKKILPRLIVCAILINLSYFIVQFLIDVSNIIGNSIGGLFDMANSGVEHTNIVGATSDGNIPENIIGLGAIIGAAGGIAALVANPAILLSFLLVLLSGVVAVIMMWLILIARQAGVVIAIVVAPVAFAMYLLPNTSKTTKSWINLVKSLLLLYPLASILIGASYFASDLLVKVDNSGNMILPAMLLRVIPFFALPALFRKSVDAMGNLGTKIQGFGRTLSRGATGAMRGADWYKNAQERGMERRTRLRAGIDQNGNEATGWRGLLRSRNDRNRARYRQQYLKTQSEQEKADLLNSPEYLEAMREKQALDRRAEQNEIDLMNSPDYRSAVRAKQDTDLEKKQTEAQASAITTGTFKRSDGIDVNTSNLSSLARALQYEASQDDAKQDISKIRALYDAILAKGDDGIDALANVWDSGTLQGKGLQRIIESIASDGNIKAKARSLHATANDVMSPSSGVSYTAGQVNAARTAGTYASKIKPEMISNMTDGERDSYIQYANNTNDSTAMRNVYLASQNINSFKPGEQAAVNDVADRYVQDHMELAKAGTYTYKDANGVSHTANLRRNADNVLVMDVTNPDGTTTATPINAADFKRFNYRLKRN